MCIMRFVKRDIFERQVEVAAAFKKRRLFQVDSAKYRTADDLVGQFVLVFNAAVSAQC